MSACRKIRGRTITFPVLLLIALFTLVITLLTNCSEGVWEPHYDEPIDSTSSDDQIAYSGLDFEILWNKDSLAGGSVSISLYRGNSFLEYIDSRTSNTGSYTWEVPASVGLGGNYRIYIKNVKDSTRYLAISFLTIMEYVPIDGYEPDGTINSATKISTDDMAQMHSFGFEEDVDFVYFWASADSFYTIRTFGRPPIILELFTSNGETVVRQPYNGNTQMTWKCDSSGYYYCMVTCDYGTSSMSYQISVAPYTPISAVVIVRPDSSQVLIPGIVDTIIWETPDSAGEVSIALVADNGDEVRSIESSVTNRGRYIWTVPPGLNSSQVYRIRITDAQLPSVAFYSGSFSIKLEPDNAEPDNSPAQATLLSRDTVLYNRTITTDDGDWFTFDAVAGRSYQIATKGATDMRLVLYDKDSVTIIRRADDGYYEKNALIAWTCMADGRHFFVASGFTNTTTGLYGLTLKTGTPPTISVAAPSPSCTSGTTTTITWKTTGFTGELARIELLKDTVVKNISFGAIMNSSYSWPISQDIASGNDYRIKVTSIADTLVSAESPVFQIVSMADAYEPDNSIGGDDTSIVFGTLQRHTLPPNDSDWIAVHFTAGHTYSIGISEINPVYVSLHRSNGTVIGNSSKSGTSDDDAKIRCICINTGFYYVLVRGSYSNKPTDHYGIIIFEE